MKFYKLFIVLILCFLVVCVNKTDYSKKTKNEKIVHNYQQKLKGEGENWIVKLNIDGNLTLNNPLYPNEYLFDNTQQIKIQYKGAVEDLGEQVTYIYKNKVWESPVYISSRNGFPSTFLEDKFGGTGLIKVENFTNSFPLFETANNVTITWKDNKEVITLQNE